jgi:hypothetical protein
LNSCVYLWATLKENPGIIIKYSKKDMQQGAVLLKVDASSAVDDRKSFLTKS